MVNRTSKTPLNPPTELQTTNTPSSNLHGAQPTQRVPLPKAVGLHSGRFMKEPPKLNALHVGKCFQFSIKLSLESKKSLALLAPFHGENSALEATIRHYLPHELDTSDFDLSQMVLDSVKTPGLQSCTTRFTFYHTSDHERRDPIVIIYMANTKDISLSGIGIETKGKKEIAITLAQVNNYLSSAIATPSDEPVYPYPMSPPCTDEEELLSRESLLPDALPPAMEALVDQPIYPVAPPPPNIRLLSKLITHQSQDYKSLQLN